MTTSHPIRISDKHAKDLALLKLAWGLPNIDAVLEKLIQPHQFEKIKALGIELPKEKNDLP